MSISEKQAKLLAKYSKSIVDVSEEVFDELLRRLPVLLTVQSGENAEEYLSNLSAELSIETNRLGPAIAWVAALSQEALEVGISKARERALEIFDIDAGIEVFKGRLDKLLSVLADSLEMLRDKTQKARTVRGLLPYFEDVQATVELRAVLGGGHKGLGHLGSPNARIVGLAPIASISINLDSGFPPQFIFQVDRDDLHRFILALTEAEKRMDELSEYVKVPSK